MPPALAAFLVAEFAFTTLVADIVAYVFFAGLAVGASLLLQKKPKSEQQQQTVKQSNPVRTRAYGRVKVAGAMALYETSGSTLYIALVHCEGPIDAYEQFWLADSLTDLTGAGGDNGTGPWGPFVFVEPHLGTATQAASPALLSAFSGLWTSAHQGKGLAYSVIRYAGAKEKNYPKVYPNGPPALRAVIRGALVYNPATTATAWSDNPALCIRDFLTHPRGYNLSATRIDDASFIAFASVCAAAVALKAGGTEPRYRLGGLYSLDQERRAVLREMLAACDGEVYLTAAGKIAIRGGVWAAPTVTLSDLAGDIRDYDLRGGTGKLAAYSRVKFTYVSPDHDYQQIAGEAWEDAALQAEIGIVDTDLPLGFVQSHSQARRLAKIATAKANPRWVGTITTPLTGIRALGERVVNLTVAEMGIVDETCIVTRFEISADMTACTIELASLGPEAYAWTPATEEGDPPPLPQDMTTAAVPPQPVNVVAQQVVGGVLTALITSLPLTGDLAGFSLIARLRRIGDTAWLDCEPYGDPSAFACMSPALVAGEAYEFQAAHAGFGGVNSGNIGPWSATQSFVITAAAPANLFPNSRDPFNWPATVGSGGTTGPHADPYGGTAARGFVFGAGTDFWFGRAVTGGTLAGQTYCFSCWVKAPSGKNQIVISAFTTNGGGAVEIFSSIVKLTSAWQRLSVKIPVTAAATELYVGIDNRLALYPTMDAAAGEVWLAYGQPELRHLMSPEAPLP